MILYNGASGGLGQYLARSLVGPEQLAHALTSRLEDQSGLAAELSQLRPRGAVTFIHLAARVSVPACEADPSGAFNTNVRLAGATVATVLDWASGIGASVRVIYASSGHVYASPPIGSRVAESAPTLPRSVYAQTKLAAEEEILSVTSDRSVALLVARVFGLLSPRQAPNYVLPALIDRARSGNLNNVPGLDFARDYLDARDVCDDLVLLSSMPWPEQSLIVNVCSGVAVTIRDLLAAVVAVIDPQRVDEVHSLTAAPGRPDDVRWLVGDPSRFVDLTGRPPQRIPMSRTVTDAVGGVA